MLRVEKKHDEISNLFTAERFQQKEKRLLTGFASNNGLPIVKKSQPTWTNGNNKNFN